MTRRQKDAAVATALRLGEHPAVRWRGDPPRLVAEVAGVVVGYVDRGREAVAPAETLAWRVHRAMASMGFRMSMSEWYSVRDAAARLVGSPP